MCDIQDFDSKVIWFYVLTLLEPPKTCAEIKKTNYFRTSHDTCVLWFYILNECMMCGARCVSRVKRSATHTVRPQCSKFSYDPAA
jgi:hypothetical protein